MIRAVTDTHALIWYLYDDKRLSAKARRFFDETAEEGGQIGFSAITLIEIVYLVERNRINPGTLELLLEVLESESSVLVELPVDRTVASALKGVSWESVPEMPDRIIAATALRLEVPVISRDRKIQSSVLKTIW
ncbi:MAG: type II toxin-antitoxin system VapC family toxin [Anaerolineales bacterium]